MSDSESCSGDPGVTREEANEKLIASAESGDHEGVSKALGKGRRSPAGTVMVTPVCTLEPIKGMTVW